MNLMPIAQFDQILRDTAAHVARQYRLRARTLRESGSAAAAGRQLHYARETVERAKRLPRAPLIQRFMWGLTNRVPTAPRQP